MPAYRLVRSGVKMTLSDYALLPAVQRTYFMIINEVEEKKRLL